MEGRRMRAYWPCVMKLGLHPLDHLEPWFELDRWCFGTEPHFLLIPGVLAFVGLPSIAVLVLGVLMRAAPPIRAAGRWRR
jgi:hypothetical protein